MSEKRNSGSEKEPDDLNSELASDRERDFFDPFEKHFVSSNEQPEFMRWLDDAPFESGTIH